MTHTVTVLLNEWRRGKASAADELLPLVYDDPASASLDFIAREVPYRLVNGRLAPIMR
jgi:hypothetical protein